MALKVLTATVLAGTLAAIAAAPQLADYLSPEDDLGTDFGVARALTVASTLSPMGTQALAESWCQSTQYPLGDSNDPEYNAALGFGYLTLQFLNPNGVPESMQVDLWIYDGPHSGRWQGVVYYNGGLPGGYQLELEGQHNSPAAGFAAAFHSALHDYPSAAVVML